MKTKWFVLIAIVAAATISGIIFQQATAQLRDRSERRLGGENAREGQFMETALDAFVNNAWTDLTFVLKVDDETLIKARPIHQAAYDEIQKKKQEIQEKIQKARESDDRRAALQELAGMRETAQKSLETAETEFDTKLATVLTEEQLTKLKELRKERRDELQERREEAQERREERGNTERGGRFRR